MNGMRTQLNLRADAPGTFHGLSSHYSGDGFSDMHFDVRALPPAQFAAWVDATKSAGPTLDPASYATLAKQSIDATPFTFGAIQPGMFQQIVTQKLPPGPGPQSGRAGVNVSPRTQP
jgi:cytochrome o ubiquinol oxidase subunit 2